MFFFYLETFKEYKHYNRRRKDKARGFCPLKLIKKNQFRWYSKPLASLIFKACLLYVYTVYSTKKQTLSCFVFWFWWNLKLSKSRRIPSRLSGRKKNTMQNKCIRGPDKQNISHGPPPHLAAIFLHSISCFFFGVLFLFLRQSFMWNSEFIYRAKLNSIFLELERIVQ